MKILVLSDLHGRFHKELESKIRKVSPNIILIAGDFCGSDKLSEFFLNKIYGKREEELDFTDVLVYKALEEISFESGINVIGKVKKLTIPTFAVRGNWDPGPFGSDISTKLTELDLEKLILFEKLQTKKFRFVDLSLVEFDKFVLVGGASSSSPQEIEDGLIEKLVKKDKFSLSEAREYVRNLRKNWNIRQKLYDKNFKRAVEIRKKTKKKIVFLTHNCPYKTKVDIVKKGPAKGKHIGSIQERLIIKKYQPDFVFCGHVHESAGMDKLGKSVIYNVGSYLTRNFTVLEI